MYLAKLARVLSHDATKLTLACKPPRKPEDATRMVLEISNTFYRIVGFYRTIPTAEAGHVFKTAYQSVVRQLLHSLISLCSSFMTTPLNTPFMVPTAALWETCEQLEKSTPKNNEQAVRLGWKQLSSTLADAKQEVHDIDQEEVAITEDADQVVEKCQKSVDLAAMILLKVERRCLAEGNTAWLDRAYKAAETLTDEADVVVSQLYEVETKQEALDAVARFRTCIADLIRIAQEVAKDEHATWFQVSRDSQMMQRN